MNAMPMGFIEFAATWNNGVSDKDSRHISCVFLPEYDGETPGFEASNHPVYMSDFFITPDQVGLGTLAPADATLQSEIMQEFASIMMEQRRNSRKGFEKHKDRRLQAFRGLPQRDNQHEEHHDRVKRARRRSPSREPTSDHLDYE
jgi:hypothetical protein